MLPSFGNPRPSEPPPPPPHADAYPTSLLSHFIALGNVETAVAGQKLLWFDFVSEISR